MEKISIVIPAYNVEKRIKKCIKSLQNQTYQNIEIICVNDGSKDNTLNVLNNMAKLDKRIIVINQKNSGPFSARKEGIMSSTGKYIMFVDSDDVICDNNACQILIDKFHNNPDVQIIQFSNKNFRMGLTKTYSPKIKSIISTQELKNKYYKDIIGNSLFDCYSPSLCNKIFITSIVKNAVEKINIDLRMGEDLYLNLSILDQKQSHNILSISDVFYQYNVGIGASSKLPDNILDEYSILKNYQLELCEKWNLCEDAKNYCNLETIYYQRFIVQNMYFNKKNDNEILEYLKQSENYDSIKKAKHYFKSLPDNELYPELLTLVNATPQEYLDYIKNNAVKPQNKIKKAINHLLNKIKS